MKPVSCPFLEGDWLPIGDRKAGRYGDRNRWTICGLKLKWPCWHQVNQAIARPHPAPGDRAAQSEVVGERPTLIQF